MNEGAGGSISVGAAFVAAFLSILPHLILIRYRIPDLYRSFFAATPPIRFWLEKRAIGIPTPAMLFGFLGGILAAISVGLIGKIIFSDVDPLRPPPGRLGWTLQTAFILAGLLEEFIKNIFALALAFFLTARTVHERNTAHENRNRIFLASTPFLCACVGLGFAFIENRFYFQDSSQMALPALILARTLISSSVHATINFHFGLSLYAIKPGQKFARILYALLFCIGSHGVFDFFALSPDILPQFLASLSLLLLIVFAIWRMQRLLPELRSHPSITEKLHRQGRDDEMREISAGFFFSFFRDPYRRLLTASPVPELFQNQPNFASDLSGKSSPDARHQMRLLACLRSLGTRWKATAVSDDAILHETDVAMISSLFPAKNSSFPFEIHEFVQKESCARESGKQKVDKKWIYATSGFEQFRERELLMSFPHPYPGARILFLMLSRLQSLQRFRPFDIIAAPPGVLGDPLNIFAGFVLLPLMDPIRRRLKRLLARDMKLPLEILCLRYDEMDFIRANGLSLYLFMLKRKGIPWANDYARRVLVTGSSGSA